MTVAKSVSAGAVSVPVVRKKKIERFLKQRAPLLEENAKKVLILKGHNTSQNISDVLRDISMLSKPRCKILSRKNDILPFEDLNSLEFLTQKSDCSLFALGSHTKKRPNNLVLGRMYDSHLLDMFEWGIDNFSPLGSVGKISKAVGSKPVFVFTGDMWERDIVLKNFQNFVIDFFRGERLEKVNISGLDHVIGCSAISNEQVELRVYAIVLSKSGSKTPNVSLEPMGPFMSLSRRRYQLPQSELWAMACKQAKSSLVPKPVKNVKRNVIGDKIGKIHVEKQSLGKLGGGSQLKPTVAGDHPAIVNSIFVHLDDKRGSVWASKFIEILIGTVVDKMDQNLLQMLTSLIGKSGVGIAFESAGHKLLTNSKQEYVLKALNKPYQKLNRAVDTTMSFNYPIRLIRSIEDISGLGKGEYGLPMIPNFPLIDAVIQPNTLINFTISNTHKGAVDSLESILVQLQESDNARFVIVTKRDNLDSFQYMDELSKINQYVTTYEPMVARKKLDEKEGISGKRKRKA